MNDPTCLIARFSVGEALAGPGGDVCIQQVHVSLFRVFVDGGLLPDGEDERQFASARLAFDYAASVVADVVAGFLFDVEEVGVGAQCQAEADPIPSLPKLGSCPSCGQFGWHVRGCPSAGGAS